MADSHSEDGIHWDRVLFSAKECVYKAWFPLTGEWLEFKDARVTIDPDSLTFVARLLNAGLNIDGVVLHELAGRFRVADGLVVTAIALEARDV